MDTNSSPTRETESARRLLGHKEVDSHRRLHRQERQHTYRTMLIGSGGTRANLQRDHNRSQNVGVGKRQKRDRRRARERRRKSKGEGRKREERRGGMRKADLNKLVKAGHLTYFSSFFLLCFAIGPSPTVRFSNFFYFILFFDWWRLRRQD